MKIENDLSKLARWLVPGWVTLLTFFIFVATDIKFTPNESNRLYPSITHFATSLLQLGDTVAIILVAAAGVPIGFLIYQAYFFIRWNSPFSAGGFLFQSSKGRFSDLDVSKRDLTDPELFSGNGWRNHYREDPLYGSDHTYQWNYFEALCLEAFQKIDSKFPGLSLYSRHRYLHEVLHTLGASIFATIVGFGGFLLIILFKFPDAFLDHIIALAVLYGFFFLLLDLEEDEKIRKAKNYFMKILPQKTEQQNLTENIDDKEKFSASSSIPKRKYGLLKSHKSNTAASVISSPEKSRSITVLSKSFLFLCTLALWHFFGNPMFNNSSINLVEMTFRVLLGLAGGAVLMVSRREQTEDVRRGDFIIISAALLTAIIIHLFTKQLSTLVDWGYFMAILEFLALIMILTKNRQNAKEEKALLEYYTLRRYLTDQDHNKDESKLHEKVE